MSAEDILEGLLPAVQEKKPDGPVMDFKVERSALLSAINAVEPVVPPKGPIPVLKNFSLRLDGLDLKISGSDSVLSVVRHLEVLSAHVHGDVLFPAQRFSSVIREAEALHEIHVRVMRKKEKLTATIKSANTQWVLPLHQISGFPDFTEAESLGLVEVEREPFLKALQQVRKAASTDPTRPYLMLVDVKQGRLRASDSIRFQQVKYTFPFDCQIPVRAAADITQRLSANNSEHIEVGQSDSALLFKIGSDFLIAQKIVAKFPDVDEVLLKPTLANDQLLKVDRETLLKAVRRVRIMADDATSAVVLSLNVGSVSVEAKDRKGGTSVETVEAEWSHPPRHVSFNHQHLSDMLSSTKSETCTFRLGKDLKTRPTPLLMEDEEDGFTAVLSQIRLDWF